MSKTELKLDSSGFDRMIKELSRKTGMSYMNVIKSQTGSILENTARRTGKSSLKKLKESIDKTLGIFFTASNGDKIRRAKNGAMIYRASSMPAGKWIKLRNTYRTNAVSAKNKSAGYLSQKYTKRINKALAGLRQAKKKIYSKKKSSIATSQASWLEIMKDLRIPIKNTRSLNKAMNTRMSTPAKRAVRGRKIISKNNPSLIISSTSKAALNPYAKGIKEFKRSFNGQAKAFATAAKKDLETYAKQFAAKNGFIVK
jgi:predicted MPP superfamily phosphohydrolase